MRSRWRLSSSCQFEIVNENSTDGIANAVLQKRQRMRKRKRNGSHAFIKVQSEAESVDPTTALPGHPIESLLPRQQMNLSDAIPSQQQQGRIGKKENRVRRKRRGE